MALMAGPSVCAALLERGQSVAQLPGGRRTSFSEKPNGDDGTLPIILTKENLKAKGMNRIVVHPDNPVRSVFELIIMFCVLYTAVVEPLKVAYLIDILPLIDVFLDVIFVFDICFQCFCGFHEFGGGQRFPVMDFRIVITHYCRSWFVIDLVAAVPFDRFVNSTSTSVFPRLPGLIKTVRLMKLKRIMRKWNSLSFGPVLKVGTVLLIWMLAAHWFACVFFMIGWYGCAIYKETWITTYWPEMSVQCHTGGVYPDPSLITESTENYNASNGFTHFSIHIRCMYWVIATMSSIGYARAPKSINDLEYAYAMFTQIVGACLAAAIFSNVASMLNKGDQVTSRYQAQLDKVREFSKLSNITGSLKRKLFGYNELLFSVSRGYDPKAIAAVFPISLQEDIFEGIHCDELRRLPILQLPELDELFYRWIARLLKSLVILEGDVIFRAGELSEHLYFLKKGYVLLGGADRSVVYAAKGPGSYLNELSLFKHALRHTNTGWSLSDCVFYTLSRKDFHEVVASCDDASGALFRKMKAIALRNHDQQSSQGVGYSDPSTARRDSGAGNQASLAGAAAAGAAAAGAAAARAARARRKVTRPRLNSNSQEAAARIFKRR